MSGLTYSGTTRPTFTCIDPDCKGGIEYLIAGGSDGLKTYGYFSCRFCYKIFKIRDQLVNEYNLRVIINEEEHKKLSYGSGIFSKRVTYMKGKPKKDKGEYSHHELVKDPEKEAHKFADKCYKQWKKSKDKYKSKSVKIHVTHHLDFNNDWKNSYAHYFLRADGERSVSESKNGTDYEWRLLKRNEQLPKPNTLTCFEDYWSVDVNPMQKTYVDNLLALKKKMNHNGLPIPHSKNIFEEVKSKLLGVKSLHIGHSKNKTPCCNEKFTRINFPLRSGYFKKRINFAVCKACYKLYEIKKMDSIDDQPIEIIEKRGTKFNE